MKTAAGRPAADDAYATYEAARRSRWDEIARMLDKWAGWGGAYHRRLTRIYQFLIPPGQQVLELGCGRGDLLAALRPARGVGIDFSGEMIRRARVRHPHLCFLEADAHDLSTLNERFDVIVLSDLVNDLWDVQRLLEGLARVVHAGTRLIINTYSRLWEAPLALVAALGLAKPNLYQNWLTVGDLANLLNLAGFEVIRVSPEILWPLPTPVLADVFDRVLVKLWPFRGLALTTFVVARPQPHPATDTLPLISVIVPARNEAGNVPEIFARTPEMGRGTELVFVEGHSCDGTFAAIEREIAAHPERRSKVYRQGGVGKGDAVRCGFANASGDILMILDADLTVPPEDLPRFYVALRTGKGEFINGVRLVYPMEDEAMRVLNLLGNKFFGWAFSWLLGQPVKDTLCGTKALWRSDYELMAANRSYFGDFDPFGDFDLLFGAAKLGLKIVDVPIRYRARRYGTTNIQRWTHGWLLLRMVAFAARRLKFV
jgi:ubiquinone/menaquinone biosynthesis C-methylase UbiE